jgi:hypothetical protein
MWYLVSDRRISGYEHELCETEAHNLRTDRDKLTNETRAVTRNVRVKKLSLANSKQQFEVLSNRSGIGVGMQ